ncbi:MAG: RidA family protein [Oligoflexales bacterium]
MRQVQRTFSGAPWEAKVGYCRAIKVKDMIFVTGTTAVGPEGGIVGKGNPYEQACRCFEIIKRSLQDLGADTLHVVRTRMFVTDIAHWKEFGRAHFEYFGEHPPATTMVEVKALIDSDMLIEIEADAVV